MVQRVSLRGFGYIGGVVLSNKVTPHQHLEVLWVIIDGPGYTLGYKHKDAMTLFDIGRKLTVRVRSAFLICSLPFTSIASALDLDILHSVSVKMHI